MKNYSNCRCCGSVNITPWLSLPDSPVANALFSKPDFERYPLELNYCSDCGHLQLVGAPDPDGVFSEYRYKSGVSNSFKKHFEKYANDIIAKYGYGVNGRVLEIGSNDGYLLEQFKKQMCEVVGVEPSKYLVIEHEDKGVPVVNNFFSTDLVKLHAWENKFDIVCANNVLAHIPDTLTVIKGVFQALRPGGILVAECGDQSGIISGKYLDNVYHEHIDYYSPYSFAQLLLRADLVVEDVQKIDTHGVSFRIIARKRIGNHSVEFDKLDMSQKRDDVQDYIASRKQNMKNILGDRKFVAYGAAAKAVTSLYTLDLVNENLTGVVDDNDLKQGYYFPGTDIIITDPTKLDKECLVLVTAWNVYEDIKRKLVERGHIGEIICMQ